MHHVCNDGSIQPGRTVSCPRCHPYRTKGSRGGSTRQGRKLRAQVLERDRYRCQIGLEGCTVDATHAHHVRPRSKGGEDTLRNLVAACQFCNLSMGNRVPV